MEVESKKAEALLLIALLGRNARTGLFKEAQRLLLKLLLRALAHRFETAIPHGADLGDAFQQFFLEKLIHVKTFLRKLMRCRLIYYTTK